MLLLSLQRFFTWKCIMLMCSYLGLSVVFVFVVFLVFYPYLRLVHLYTSNNRSYNWFFCNIFFKSHCYVIIIDLNILANGLIRAWIAITTLLPKLNFEKRHTFIQSWLMKKKYLLSLITLLTYNYGWFALVEFGFTCSSCMYSAVIVKMRYLSFFVPFFVLLLSSCETQTFFKLPMYVCIIGICWCVKYFASVDR